MPQYKYSPDGQMANRADILNSIAAAFQNKGKPPGTGTDPAQAAPSPTPTPDAPAPESATCPTCGSQGALSDHSYDLYQKAQAAKQKYMQENNVDENNEPIQK